MNKGNFYLEAQAMSERAKEKKVPHAAALKELHTIKHKILRAAHKGKTELLVRGALLSSTAIYLRSGGFQLSSTYSVRKNKGYSKISWKEK